MILFLVVDAHKGEHGSVQQLDTSSLKISLQYVDFFSNIQESCVSLY
jgi:hypothetical protein